MRTRPAYYRVHALRDGTICLAFQTRKPRKPKYGRRPQIDDDGIYDWYVDEDDDLDGWTDWARGARMVAITTTLNVKRILRLHVTTRIDALQREVEQLTDAVTKLEQRLDDGSGES
jgi:hypothetical protein